MDQNVSTNTSHVTSCIVMLKQVLKKFRCWRNGKRAIGSRISSLYFTAINVPWTILSWVRPSWQIPAQTMTLPPPKRSDSYTHWSVKRSPHLRYTHNVHRWSEVKITKKDVLPGVKPPTTAFTSPCQFRGPMALFSDWSYHRTPSSESTFT